MQTIMLRDRLLISTMITLSLASLLVRSPSSGYLVAAKPLTGVEEHLAKR